MSRNSFLGGALAGVLLGCGPAVATDGTDASTGTGTTETTSGTPGTTSSATSPATTLPVTSAGTTVSADDTTSTSAQDEESSGSTSSISSGFITDPDGGFYDAECMVWEKVDSCLRGEECRPWANDGGSVWTASRCVPLPEDPDLVGEPCVAEGSAVTGVDTCGARSMCFGVDPDTLEGTCVAYCEGDAENPVCADPTTTCVIGNEGVIALCLPGCDPLLQDCANEEMCTGNFEEGTGFFCMPSGTPYINAMGVQPAACNVEQIGVRPALVDGCLDDEPCCTTFCDLSELDGCGDGLECVPWLSEGTCPGVCDEGVCLTPN